MNISSTSIQKITTQHDMDSFVSTLNLKSDTIIVKPNWVSYSTGEFTDAKVLDMFLNSISRPVTFVESYTFWRTDKMAKNEGDYFSSSEATLETGKSHWDFFREQDKLFLETTGIAGVLSKHHAEYVCITEEVWSGRTVKSDVIRDLVEAKYPPVDISDIYGYIPQKLFDLKGSDFISLAKAKLDSSYGASLSIKNSFGLIPDPTRYVKYHGGEKENLLVQSVVDINKLYQALFNSIFVVEGVFNNCFMNWDTNKAEPFFDWGVILGGKDGLEVDTLGCALLGTNFKASLADLKSSYKSVFGGNDSINMEVIPENYFQKGKI